MAWPLHRIAAALFAAIVVPLAACAPHSPGSAAPSKAVYALRGADGTVTKVDLTTGRAGRPSGEIDPRPLLMAPGPDGSLVLVSRVNQTDDGLTVLQALPGGRVVRRMTLPALSGDARLASDGGRYAVVAHGALAEASRERFAHRSGSDWRCHVSVIDLQADTAIRTFPLCLDGELVTGLAVDSGPTRTLLFAGLSRYRPSGDRSGAAASGGRVIAMDVHTGTVVSTFLTGSAVGALAVVRAGDGLDDRRQATRRLYVVERAGGLEDEHAPGGGWRLIGLDPHWLTVEHVQPLNFPLRRLAPAPDGMTLYAISDTGRSLVEVDLANRSDRGVAQLPAEALDLLATHDRVIVASVPDWTPASSAGLWQFDRRTRRVSTLGNVRGAIALAVPTLTG